MSESWEAAFASAANKLDALKEVVRARKWEADGADARVLESAQRDIEDAYRLLRRAERNIKDAGL